MIKTDLGFNLGFLGFYFIEKATASAADLWDPMHGYLDAWMLVVVLPGGRFGTDLGCILEALGHLWCHLEWSLKACGGIWI